MYLSGVFKLEYFSISALSNENTIQNLKFKLKAFLKSIRLKETNKEYICLFVKKTVRGGWIVDTFSNLIYIQEVGFWNLIYKIKWGGL